MDVGGQRVRVNDSYKQNCIDAIDDIVVKL